MTIKPLIPGLWLVLCANPTAAETIIGNPPACYDPLWLERMLVFAKTEDRASFERYLDIGKCALLKEGMQITVSKRYRNADNQERVEFVFKGLRLYTLREAVGQDL